MTRRATDAEPVRQFLWAAEAGLPLVPIRPDDARPTRVGWQRLATTNLATIQDWATRHQAMAVATGRACDIFDIEVEHLDRVRGLIGAHRGPMAESARGGIHLYTKPTGLGCPRLFVDGVHIGELKGRGGTCTVPPSRRPKGDYAWMTAPWDAAPAPATPELLALIPSRSEPRLQTRAHGRSASGAAAALERLAQKVAHTEQGNRNGVLFWASCRALEQGLPVALTRRVLTRAAADAGLDADEATRTIESAVRHVG